MMVVVGVMEVVIKFIKVACGGTEPEGSLVVKQAS